MSEIPPSGQAPPSHSEPRAAPASYTPEPEKRPVSVRARETAGTGYRAVRWIVLLVLVVIAVVFIIRNFEDVRIDWVFRTSDVPLSIVMILFLAIGLVIGWLFHWFSMRAQRRR